MDFNTEYMFGESVGLLSGNASDAANTFHGALDYAQDGVIFRLRLGKIMWLHRDIKFKDTCNIIHIYADKYVARALEHRRQQKLRPSDIDDKESNESNKKIFLYELAKDSDDPIVLRDQIVNMILAARDTTSGLLAFTFYMLARHSQVFKKLRAEVLEHYCDPLTYEAVMEMTYLRFVLHESKSFNSLSIYTILKYATHKSFASFHPSQPTAEWLNTTPSSPWAAVPMANLLC